MFKLSFITINHWRNSYEFVSKQVRNSSKQNLNLYLLKRYTEKDISSCIVDGIYEKLITNNLLFIFPTICSTDEVYITKNISEFREYRFFTFWSMVYYYSLSLYFNDLIETVGMKSLMSKSNVLSISPSLITKNNDKYKIKSDYKGFYNQFVTAIEENLRPKQIVINLDIKDFYSTIDHEVMLDILMDMMKPSELKKFELDSYRETILFCFKSLMLNDKGIPQGKRVYASDLFGNLVLSKLDLNVEELCKSDLLSVVKIVRYVDDVFIILDRNGTTEVDSLKEGVRIEKKISSWLHHKLKLKLNHSKTKITNIKTKNTVITFLEQITRITSKIDEDEKVTDMLVEYLDVIESMNFKKLQTSNFLLSQKDRNVLKYIFKNDFKKFVNSRKASIGNALDLADVELASVESNLTLPLFLYEDRKSNTEKYPFLHRLVDFFMDGGSDLTCKSNIEVTIQLYIHNNCKILEKEILSSVENHITSLQQDSLGRYLLFLTGKLPKIYPVYDFSTESIPFSICNSKSGVFRYLGPVFKQILYLSRSSLDSKQRRDLDVMISQLSRFLYCYNKSELSLALNHFHSFYEASLSLVLGESSLKLKDMKSKMLALSDLITILPQDQIYLMQFSDRRNFNIVSHATNRNIPTLEVQRDEVVLHVTRVCETFKKYRILHKVIIT